MTPFRAGRTVVVTDREEALAVELDVHLPQLPEDRARAVVERTRTICPCSRATAGNVDVRPEVDDHTPNRRDGRRYRAEPGTVFL